MKHLEDSVDLFDMSPYFGGIEQVLQDYEKDFQKEKYIQRLFQHLKILPPWGAEYTFFYSAISDLLDELKHGSLAMDIAWNKPWQEKIHSPLGQQILETFLLEDKKSFTPTEKLLVLVIDTQNSQGFLYFQKQWNTYLELSQLMKHWLPVLGQKRTFSWSIQDLEELLREFSTIPNPEQKNAIIHTLNSPFSIITGGPGTGKTTVVSFILEGILKKNPDAQLALLAPTGRASARLQESLEKNLQEKLTPSFLLERLKKTQIKTQTIHSFLYPTERLLQDELGKPMEVYLSLDLLMIDEISMVSPSLFKRLMQFISPQTQVVLLGDPHQLPSVEEGFLLGYFLSENSHFFKHCVYELKTLVRAQDSADLTKLILYTQQQIQSKKISYAQQKEIPSMIQSISMRDFDLLMHRSVSPGVYFLNLEDEKEQTIQNILEIYLEKYQFPSQNSSISSHNIFNKYYQSQILTPMKKGNMGTKYINNYCHQSFLKRLSLETESYYLPIIVERNQSHLGLFNGDLGLLKHFYKNSYEELVFPSLQDGLVYTKDNVQDIDYCFAMTVHKSQGSEFQEILLFLPSYALNKVFSEEVFYTGISRAKKRVFLIGKKEVLLQGLEYSYRRNNGLPL